MCSSIDAPGKGQINPRPLELLEREICELHAHLSAATCRWLDLLAEFDAREGWAEWGVTTCAHWLSWRLGIGLNAGREHVRVARNLQALPLLRKEFASGRLSYSKVRAVTRVATEETEADLVMIALHATGAQLETLCRGYRRVIRATLREAQAAHERQRLDVAWEDDGMLRVEGRLTAEDGAALVQALRDQAPLVAAEVREISAGAARAQSLMQLIRGDGGGAEVVVHVDAETLSSDKIHQRSEIESGPTIPPETVRRLACDGGVVRIVERDGRPLSVGRRTRAISPALRRALRSRDGVCCRFPGCTHTKHLHGHHIHHWAKGGETTIENLVQLCPHHHRLVHEGGYSVEATRGGTLRFRRPSGAAISEVCGARPARGIGIERQNSALDLHVDFETGRPLSAGDRLDYGLAVAGLAWKDRPPGQS